MQTASESASNTDLRTHEPNQAQAILQDRFARHSLRVLDTRRTLDFSLRQAQLDRVTFLLVSYGRDVEIVTSGFGDFYLLQLTLTGTCETTTGTITIETGPGHFHVVNPGTAYRKRWSSDASQLILRLPRQPLEQLATADSDDEPVLFEQSPDPVPTTVDELVKFFWCDVTTAGRARSRVIDRSASRHLMTVVLHSLPNSAASVLTPDEPPACLPRADRFIRQHLANDIGLTQIAENAGVSTRYLEDAFRRHWRTTPMAHVRNLRLEVTHHLLTHPVDGMSVTEAALTAGISHLGRFSRDYRRRYGELPSESLRRALSTRS
jgi:AraC-like DNA-binding protein